MTAQGEAQGGADTTQPVPKDGREFNDRNDDYDSDKDEDEGEDEGDKLLRMT